MSTKRSALALAAILAAASSAAAQEFAYSGDLGPAHWGELSPDWELCGSGDEQSPVDLAHRRIPVRRAKRLALESHESEGEIFDNGHTIEVEVEGENALELDGERYELVQFHFHSPSEHVVDGRGYDLELHLVHRSEAGELAVVGVFLQRGPTSGALAPIFEQLPDEVGPHVPLAEPFDPSEFLPRSRRHFRYRGSLTTPPCSEGVRWMVLREPISISDEHMARFDEIVRFNARPAER
jgi:carbonic anhydrase